MDTFLTRFEPGSRVCLFLDAVHVLDVDCVYFFSLQFETCSRSGSGDQQESEGTAILVHESPGADEPEHDVQHEVVRQRQHAAGQHVAHVATQSRQQ